MIRPLSYFNFTLDQINQMDVISLSYVKGSEGGEPDDGKKRGRRLQETTQPSLSGWEITEFTELLDLKESVISIV